jgi:hypothetical protein
LNETSVRAMVSETRHLEHRRLAGARDGTPDRRASGNDIQRCILLLNHLFEHDNPDAVEEQLLPELLRVFGELKRRQTRREATRDE